VLQRLPFTASSRTAITAQTSGSQTSRLAQLREMGFSHLNLAQAETR
jgi:hypothetical protein